MPTPPFPTDWLARQARYRPDAPALTWQPTGEQLSFAELNSRGEALAAAFTERFDLVKGDRVAILAPNSLAHVLLFVAAQKAGWILVPLNARLTAAELQHMVDDTTPQLFVTDDALTDTAEALTFDAPRLSCGTIEQQATAKGLAFEGRRLGADDPLMILYTSGTTGRPKGALYTHGMCFYNAVNTVQRLHLTGADVSFNAAPFHHTGGWNVLLTPFLLQGGHTLLLDGFDADVLLPLCDEAGISILWGVPTMLKLMADSPHFNAVSLDGVRYAIVGGEAMPAPLIHTWQGKGVPIRQGFGMTEVGPNCFSLPERDALRKIGSIGLPNFLIDTRVVDADGQDLPLGATGELLMRGPVVTPGYWQHPEGTAAAFDGDWFRTGDLVRQDDEGYFFVAGRKKELYISGGENVYPAEVEAVLHAHEFIREAAVVGVPDDRWGETGMAFVVADAPSLSPEAVTDFCRQRLAAYKVPRHIRFVDSLPKNHSGKIDKQALRTRAERAVSST